MLRLRLRLPAGERLATARILTRRVRFDAATGTIVLPAGARVIDLIATVARARA